MRETTSRATRCACTLTVQCDACGQADCEADIRAESAYARRLEYDAEASDEMSRDDARDPAFATWSADVAARLQREAAESEAADRFARRFVGRREEPRHEVPDAEALHGRARCADIQTCPWCARPLGADRPNGGHDQACEVSR